MRHLVALGLLLVVVPAVPAWAGDSSLLDANYADSTAFGELPRTLSLFGAPSAASESPPSRGLGVSTPWGFLDVSLSDPPTSLPFRMRLDPRADSESTDSGLALVPYLALGRTDRLDSEMPDGLRALTQDRTRQLKTAAGLSWLLGDNTEISGEYHFAGIGRPGPNFGPTTLDRAINTSPDSLGFSLNFSIKY